MNLSIDVLFLLLIIAISLAIGWFGRYLYVQYKSKTQKINDEKLIESLNKVLIRKEETALDNIYKAMEICRMTVGETAGNIYLTLDALVNKMFYIDNDREIL